MNAKSYILAGIIAAITANAFATGENTVTSKSYVDAQDALKQDLITTGMVEVNIGKAAMSLPALVSYDTTNGLAGNQIGLFKSDSFDGTALQGEAWWLSNAWDDSVVPSILAVRNMYVDISNKKQNNIPKSGNYGASVNDVYTEDSAIHGWLDANVAGTGLVTKTSEAGRVGERKIFEASDVSGYHDTNLSQNEKDIQDISIPTVGAMMSAISAGVSAGLPTGTAGHVVTYDANGNIGGSLRTADTLVYNASGSVTNRDDIATISAVNTREAKMTCAGWPDSVAVADRTDANCWLWQRN